MGNLENLKQAEQDLGQLTQSKRGRRVILALVGVGFIAVIILLAAIRSC